VYPSLPAGAAAAAAAAADGGLHAS
jgi:hypothetical protein